MRLGRLGVLSSVFGFAFLFWAYARLSQTYVAELHIPLRVQLPPELALRKMPPPVLTVHVQGTGWQLLVLELWERPREGVLAVSEAQEGATVGVGRQHLMRLLSLPTAVTVLHIVPDTLTLCLERALRKRLPVMPAVQVELPSGFRVAQLRVEPESVTVWGAREALTTLAAVFPAETHLVPSGWELTREIPLVVAAPLPVRLEPNRVRISVRIEPEAERVLEDVPVEIAPAFLGSKYVVVPRRLRLWVRGTLTQVLALTPRDFRITLSGVTLMQDTSGVVVPQIQSPGGVEVFRLEPPALLYWQQE